MRVSLEVESIFDQLLEPQSAHNAKTGAYVQTQRLICLSARAHTASTIAGKTRQPSGNFPASAGEYSKAIGAQKHFSRYPDRSATGILVRSRQRSGGKAAGKVHEQKAFRSGQSYRPGCIDRVGDDPTLEMLLSRIGNMTP